MDLKFTKEEITLIKRCVYHCIPKEAVLDLSNNNKGFSNTKLKKLEEERLVKLKTVFTKELKKNTEAWEKIINQTVKQINSTKKLHEQLLDAIPNVRQNFSTYFFPENIYKWFLLALASREKDCKGVGTFLKVSNRMTYPPINRKVLMSEHYPWHRIHYSLLKKLDKVGYDG
jgi:hypothetical protein